MKNIPIRRQNALINKAQKKLNNTFEKYGGFKITRSYKRTIENRKLNFKNSRPTYFEFIGVSGVGKTTLYRELCKVKKKDWLHIYEYREFTIGKKNDNLLDRNNIYQYLAKSKLDDIINSDYSVTDKLRILSNSYAMLVDDAMIRIYNDKRVTVISDEGLFHNYGRILEKLFHERKDDFSNLMNGRAVIYCHAPSQIIARQIMDRNKRTGKISPQHKGDSIESLTEKVDISIEEKKRMVSLLQEYMPVLSIDTSTSLLENASKVAKFITKHRQMLQNDSRN